MPTPHARILIVDDEPAVRSTLGEYLEREGYAILFAETALGALGAVREHRPNVVLLDLNMPGAVHGDAIIASISQTVPVIVITSTIDPDVMHHALQQGAADFIAKPFQLARVAEVVGAVLLSSRP